MADPKLADAQGRTADEDLFDLPVHPAAELLPLLEGKPFDELVEDIRIHGQLEPIVTLKGQVLDGRNRLRGCKVLGIDPKFREWDGEGTTPVGYVIGANLHRRHLTASQRAMVVQRAMALLEEEARARKSERVSEANRSRASSDPVEGSNSLTEPKEFRREPERASDQAGEIAGVSGRYVREARAVEAAAPELAEQVLRGERTLTQARRELAKRAAKPRAMGAGPDAVYEVIVVDPPWGRATGGEPEDEESTRPTMTQADLAALDLPGATDCHVWVWSTHDRLPATLKLLRAWKLEYEHVVVWQKPGGQQQEGQPDRTWEFAIYARRGKPTFASTDGLSDHIREPSDGPGEKPGEFYEMVRSATDGRRLVLFGTAVEGFERGPRRVEGATQ